MIVHVAGRLNAVQHSIGIEGGIRARWHVFVLQPQLALNGWEGTGSGIMSSTVAKRAVARGFVHSAHLVKLHHECCPPAVVNMQCQTVAATRVRPKHAARPGRCALDVHDCHTRHIHGGHTVPANGLLSVLLRYPKTGPVGPTQKSTHGKTHRPRPCPVCRPTPRSTSPNTNASNTPTYNCRAHPVIPYHSAPK